MSTDRRHAHQHAQRKSSAMKASKKYISPIQIAVLLLILIRVIDQIRKDQQRAVLVGSQLAKFSEYQSSDDHVDGATILLPRTFDKNGGDEVLVKYGDSIYSNNDWDGAPIVLEKYKLVFFTTPKIGCTTWKQLFRRMMGIPQWRIEEYRKMIPWNPQTNGLKYLYHYDRETASAMMTRPDWTRALFVRDPKERFLSAYLDKAKGNPNYIREKCCGYTGECVSVAEKSPAGFLQVAHHCDNAHWKPQNMRMDAKYWSHINFVGHMHNLQEDAERLLRLIGAWDRYGATGWGTHQNQSVFSSGLGGVGRRHSTDAKSQLREYITPELEIALNEYYADDYLNPVLNLTWLQIFE